MITKPTKVLIGSLAAVTAATTLAVSGPATQPAQAASGSVKIIRTLVTGENVPWGMVRLPDGNVVYTTRDTHLVRLINMKTGTYHTLGRIKAARSNTSAGGEAGLLGITVDRQFNSDHVFYIYYSTSHDNRVARVHYYPGRKPYHRLGGLHVIKKGIPHGVHHNGGQLKFGPDGMLYVSTGEAGNSALAQKKSSLGGKILRITRYGKPAKGNPIKGSSVWTWGHRNVQGLAVDPSDRLWASEFGDRKADELNLIKRGHNYGWPATQGRTSSKKYTSPVAQWGTEVDSPSGIAYTNNTIWMAALKGERLWRIPMRGARTAAAPKAYLVGKYGRLRSVLWVGKGKLLVSTSNTDGRANPGRKDDRILELSVR